MKKNLTMAYLAIVALGATMTFSACSNSDELVNEINGDNVTQEEVSSSAKALLGTGPRNTRSGADSTAVNPTDSTTANPAAAKSVVPKTAGGMTVQTNAKGQVVALQGYKKKVTFEYKESVTRAVTTPDVVMTVEDLDDREKTVYNLLLNNNGLVKYSEGTSYSNRRKAWVVTEKWNFTYNNDGQLLTVSYVDNDETETTTLTYNNEGNVTTVKCVSQEGRKTETDNYTVSYTSNTVTTPLLNKGAVMLFDETFEVDLDDMEYAYFAGLLGNSTKNLPVQLVENGYKTEVDVFQWTLDANGYPTLCKYGNDYDDKYTFSW